MEGKIARKKLNATAEARMGSEPFVMPFQKNPATSYTGSFSKPGKIIFLEFLTKKATNTVLAINCMNLIHMKNYFRNALSTPGFPQFSFSSSLQISG